MAEATDTKITQLEDIADLDFRQISTKPIRNIAFVVRVAGIVLAQDLSGRLFTNAPLGVLSRSDRSNLVDALVRIGVAVHELRNQVLEEERQAELRRAASTILEHEGELKASIGPVLTGRRRERLRKLAEGASTS